MNIKISADSTCDLSQQLIEQYDIGITPLYIAIGDETRRDMLEVTAADIYAAVDAGERIGTAAVNIQDYIDAFSGWLSDHDAVIHFTISSEMSSCYQNACVAAAELENVYVIDSRSLSTGIGLLVLDAAEKAAEGMEPAAIKDALDAKKEKLDVSFVLDTLDYLRKGGRCSAVAAFGANLLKLRPCIQVRDGVMGVGKKYRGTPERCWLDYFKDKLAEPDTVDTRRVFLTDSGLTEAERDTLESELLKLVPFETVYRTQAGSTICSHCGPRCMGILFYRK